jgi:DNA (cytosine-5)-methyltransferase 1
VWWAKSRRAQNTEDYETWLQGGVTPTLNAFDNANENRATVLIIDGTRVGDVRVYEDQVMQTVIQRWGTGGGNVPAIMSNEEPIVMRDREGCAGGGKGPLLSDKAFTLASSNFHTLFPNSATVRRLTPTECERLQGFPDGWTAEQADSNRYKQMGNAVAVPVVQWIINNVVGDE